MKKRIVFTICVVILLFFLTYGMVYFRYSAKNITLLQQVNIEKMFLSNSYLNLRYIRYYEKDQRFDIHCTYTGQDITDDVYDEGISLYNNILLYILENNDEINSMKFDLYICNGPPTYYLLLKNYMNNKDDIYEYCISAYSGMNDSFYYSDEELFHEKYPMIQLDY